MSHKHSDLHDEIVEVLFELCKKAKTRAGKPMYSSIYADHIGQEYEPIILSADIGKRKKPIAKKYNPDIWARVKGKRLYDIFEVWHSETEAEAVEDILFSSLFGGLQYLCIVCTGYNLTVENAEELVNIIIHRITYEEEEIPFEVYITDLPMQLSKNKTKMKNYLKKKLEF